MKPKQIELKGEGRRGMGRPLLWCLLSLVMVSAWAGCKQDARIAADTDPVGTYILVSVDGNKLPYTLKHEGAVPTVKSGTFTITSDGTCSSKIILSLPSGGDSGREVKATYTRQGATLTMKWEGAGTTSGTVQGNTFTMTNEGMVFAYQK